ncbi:ABC transporter substrate-binding protein [Cohnella zeiphila]|uniref:Extracellular solute-binding protein n=1 Tax=Cohnella zeiphila TaxID=2761120 RepID=A0A7X0SHT7_9BACL|nr:extracellular solute-binding protein [Cohnella zeiphila]MBB6730250.1 extracellular solute-binding protein [Cohnella zeiphila]
MMKKRSAPWAVVSSALLLSAVLSACNSGGNDPDGASPSGSSAGASSPSSAAASGSDSQTGADGKTTLTVAVYTEDRFLKSAVEQFEQAHPDIDVQIQETMPTDTSEGKQTINIKNGPDEGPSAADKDKYINSVNTALMSGNAADLISVNYLPVDRYLDKGMFEDWSQLAGQDSDFHTADYYENVLKGMSDSHGWYAIPIDYQFNAILANKAALDKVGGIDDKTWTWEQFVDLCKQIASAKNADGTNMHALGGEKPEDVIGYLAESAYDKLVTKSGNTSKFDEEAFRGYLELVKQLYDSGAVSADSLGKANEVFSPMSMESPMQLATMPSKLGNNEGEVLHPPGSGQDEGFPFTSDLAFALNARSKAKPAAWEFVKFLLSKDVQSLRELMGIPVQQAAAKQKLEDTAQDIQSGRAKIVSKGPDGSVQAITITDEQIQAALALLPSVGKYERKDDKVIDMINEESASFFSGGKSADAVAKAVASRVDTYLNE